jgi:hypothetical protein
MTNAIRDNNHQPVLLGVLFSDGVTLVPIKIDAATGGIAVNTSDTIGFTPDQDALEDGNYVPNVLAQDSTDATKRCPIYVDADGAVLVAT